jgi:hypothetical protein
MVPLVRELSPWRIDKPLCQAVSGAAALIVPCQESPFPQGLHPFINPKRPRSIPRIVRFSCQPDQIPDKVACAPMSGFEGASRQTINGCCATPQAL